MSEQEPDETPDPPVCIRPHLRMGCEGGEVFLYIIAGRYLVEIIRRSDGEEVSREFTEESEAVAAFMRACGMGEGGRPAAG